MAAKPELVAFSSKNCPGSSISAQLYSIPCRSLQLSDNDTAVCTELLDVVHSEESSSKTHMAEAAVRPLPRKRQNEGGIKRLADGTRLGAHGATRHRDLPRARTSSSSTAGPGQLACSSSPRTSCGAAAAASC